MAWYRAGSVTVTNGSAVVTGAGTSFVANVQAGHAINLPDGRAYEVLSVDSNTQLTLGSGYLGGTAGGQAYSVQPNQGFAQTAATRLSEFLTQVSGWVSGALSGRFGDGSTSSPGISFAADQDTGVRRSNTNEVAIVTGGIDRVFFTTAGVDVSGRVIAAAPDTVGVAAPQLGTIPSSTAAFLTNANRQYGLVIGQYGNTGHTWVQSQRTDGNPVAYDLLLQPSGGNLLIGTSSGSSHAVTKVGLAEGGIVLQVDGGAGSGISGQFRRVNANAYNGGAPAALMLGNHSSNGRSLSAGGTLNASGADYAEYMTKAAGCGTITKGDVCGVDADGKLTKSWAAAISFVVKSTDPAYVGGDSWASHMPERPTDPGASPAEPVPLPLPDDASDEDRQAAAHAYRAACDAYAAAKVAHDDASARYATELPVWEADLEAARQCVDRIAFAGQVPVNISGEFAVGDYLIAAAKGGGIQAVAVAEKDITFDQYRRRLGKVWAVRDGRPWMDVQHG